MIAITRTIEASVIPFSTPNEANQKQQNRQSHTLSAAVGEGVSEVVGQVHQLHVQVARELLAERGQRRLQTLRRDLTNQNAEGITQSNSCDNPKQTISKTSSLRMENSQTTTFRYPLNHILIASRSFILIESIASYPCTNGVCWFTLDLARLLFLLFSLLLNAILLFLRLT